MHSYTNCPSLDVKEGINTDTLVPVFYVEGETSPLPEMPNQDPRLIDRVKNVFSVNKVTTDYDVNFDEKDSWAAWDFLSHFKCQDCF